MALKDAFIIAAVWNNAMIIFSNCAFQLNIDFRSHYKRHYLGCPDDSEGAVVEPGHWDVGFEFFDTHEDGCGGPFADSDVDAFPVIMRLSRHVHEPIEDQRRSRFLEPWQVAGKQVVEGVGDHRP